MGLARCRGAVIPIAAMLLLILNLPGIGVVYASWREEVRVRGVVKTGQVDAAWVATRCTEFNGWPSVPPVAPLGEVGGRDVASTTVEISADGRDVTVTLASAYPRYASMCDVEARNTGSVPWSTRGVRIRPLSSLTACLQSGTTSRRVMRCQQLTVIYSSTVGARINSQRSQVNNLRLHVEPGAAESRTYRFRVEQCLAQWNGRPSSSQCFADLP